MAKTDIATLTRIRLWVPRRCTSSSTLLLLCDCWPTLRAMTDEVPMLIPKAILVRTIVRGNVKVIAATWAVLSWPMKPISRTCTRMLEETPIIIGAVNLASDIETGPCVRSVCGITGVSHDWI